MKKVVYIIITIFLLLNKGQAQQLPLSSLYNVNKFQINSAYAGFNDCLEGYLSHRSQWVGINGAPTTEFLSVHSGIGKNVGIGANLVYDKTNIISKFSGSIALAYRVKLGLNHNLRLGFSGGIFQISTTPSNAIVDDVNDNIVLSGNQSSMAFNNNLSAYYNHKKLEIGVSVPQFLELNTATDIGSSDGGFQLKRHIISTVGYDFNVSEKVSIQPSVLHRTFNGSQNQLDINGQVTFNQLVFVGLGYRTSAGLLARLGMNVKDLFKVAYAYDFAGGNLSGASSGSHEIMLGVRFCRNKSEKIVEVIPDVISEPIVEKAVEKDSVVVIEADTVMPLIVAEKDSVVEVVPDAISEPIVEKVVEKDIIVAIEVDTIIPLIVAEKDSVVEVAPDVISEPIVEKVTEKEYVVVETDKIIPLIVAEKDSVIEVVPDAIPELIVEKVTEKEELSKKEKQAFDTKVYFLKNSSDFDDSYKKNLNEVAKKLANNRNMRVDIVGHSCDLGDAETRERIGRKRAEVIRNYLIRRNVSSSQIKIGWMSDKYPLVPNTSEVNRLKNRRVEFIMRTPITLEGKDGIAQYAGTKEIRIKKEAIELNEREKKVFDTRIHFLKNSSYFDDSYRKNLNEVAKKLVKNPNLKIQVVGHSCDLGDTQTRKEISRERAEVIRDYLIGKKVRSFQMDIEWMSDKYPIVPNTSETNRLKNRRVEFVITK